MTTRRVRLTRTGVAVAIVSAVVLAGGWWTRYPELAMIGAVGGAAVLAALGRAMLLPPTPVISRQRPDAAVGGDLEVFLLARDSVQPNGPWRFTDRVLRPGAAGTREELLLVVPREAIGYLLTAERRGRHVFGPCTAHWQDVFGLVRAEQVHKETVTAWVRPWTDDSVRPASGRAGSAGQVPSDSSTNGDAFYGLRSYQPGDDVRLVDWRATARQPGQLIVRQYAAPDPVPAPLPHLVVLDAAMASYPGPPGESAFDDAVEITASLCAVGVRSGQPTVLSTTADSAEAPLSDGLDDMLDRLAQAVRIAGNNAWRHEMRVRAGALTVVTGTAGPDATAWLAAIDEDLPAVTIVRVGARNDGPGVHAPPGPAGDGVTQIAVPGIGLFAHKWNSREYR